MSLRSWELSVLCHLTLDFPTFRLFANVLSSCWHFVLMSSQPSKFPFFCHFDFWNFDLLVYWLLTFGFSILSFPTLYFSSRYHFDCLTFRPFTCNLGTFHYNVISTLEYFRFRSLWMICFNSFWPSNFSLLCYQWHFGLYVNSVLDLCHSGLWTFHFLAIWHLDLLNVAHFAEC